MNKWMFPTAPLYRNKYWRIFLFGISPGIHENVASTQHLRICFNLCAESCLAATETRSVELAGIGPPAEGRPASARARGSRAEGQGGLRKGQGAREQQAAGQRTGRQGARPVCVCRARAGQRAAEPGQAPEESREAAAVPRGLLQGPGRWIFSFSIAFWALGQGHASRLQRGQIG